MKDGSEKGTPSKIDPNNSKLFATATRVSAKGPVQDYYDTWAEVYDTSDEWFEHYVRASRKVLLSLFANGTLEGKKAVDVGCGIGTFSEVLALLGAEVVGLDISRSMVNQASFALIAFIRLITLILVLILPIFSDELRQEPITHFVYTESLVLRDFLHCVQRSLSHQYRSLFHHFILPLIDSPNLCQSDGVDNAL
jgi:SAM-dependent methyltransferase